MKRSSRNTDTNVPSVDNSSIEAVDDSDGDGSDRYSGDRSTSARSTSARSTAARSTAALSASAANTISTACLMRFSIDLLPVTPNPSVDQPSVKIHCSNYKIIKYLFWSSQHCEREIFFS